MRGAIVVLACLLAVPLPKAPAVASVKASGAASTDHPAIFRQALDYAVEASVTEPNPRDMVRDAVAGIAESFPDGALDALLNEEMVRLDALTDGTDEDTIAAATDVFLRVFDAWSARAGADEEALLTAALSAAMDGLDPHSSYYSPAAVAEYRTQLSGEFVGLGVEITIENDLIKVITPLDGTPADKAGVRPGDVIVEIDASDTRGMSLTDAVGLMRGPKGTAVEIVLQRDGQRLPLTIERDTVRTVTARTERHGDVGYIRLTAFNEQTVDQLETAIADLRDDLGDDARGFVLDLRNNPGGLLDVVIETAGKFLDGATVMISRGRRESDNETIRAPAGDLLDGAPLVVLVNGGSASGTEILAGALGGNGRALLVGARTFGNGTAQTVTPLDNGGFARVTTSRFFTPDDREIQARGIDPDVVIEPSLPDGIASTTVAGESALEGHLAPSAGDRRQAGSAHVPADRAEDLQFQAALRLAAGEARDAVLADLPAPPTCPDGRAHRPDESGCRDTEYLRQRAAAAR